MNRRKTDNIPLSESEEVTSEVVVIDEQITQELAKKNITESALAEMEATFLPLTIDGIDDKEGYNAVHKARIACRNTRNLTVEVCKAGREELILRQKAWIKKEKDIVDRIKNVENTLAEREKAIDDEKEKIKREEDEKKQMRLQQRAATLIKFGMELSGEAYVLNEIKISVLQVKETDDFTFNALLAQVETVWKEHQEIEKERKRKEEESAAIAKKMAEEALAKQEENRRKEEELFAREKALQEAEQAAKEKAESEARAKAEAEAKEKVEAEKRRQKAIADTLKLRKASLFALGFSQQGEVLSFKEVKITEKEISEHLDLDWIDTLGIIEGRVKDIKDRIEKERIAREEQIKAEAEAEAKRKLEAEAKIKAEKEAAEKAEADRLAALAPDTEKLNSYLRAIFKISIPDFTTDSYKEYGKYLNAAKEKALEEWYNNKPK